MKKVLFGWIFLTLFVLPTFSDALLAGTKGLKIAMVLWRGETEAEKGFQDSLKELGYSVQYTVMNAGQDRTELGRLLREELKPKLDNFDYIYVFGTTVASATKSIVQDKVPQIFNIVADPVGAGIVQSSESPGGNVAGATNEIPLPLQIQTALKLSRLSAWACCSTLAKRIRCWSGTKSLRPLQSFALKSLIYDLPRP